MRKSIWLKRLRTFVSCFALPFVLLAMILEELLTMRSSGSDMECIAMEGGKCKMFTDADCSKCSFYEPKAAYPLRVRA